MVVNQEGSATVATAPERATARLMRRNALVAGAVWAAAVLVLVVTDSPAAHAFADGMFFPGGGFLATGDLALFAVTLLAFAVAFAAWFVVGIIVAPAVVWLGAAGLAAARAESGSSGSAADVIVPVTLGVIALGGVVGHLVRTRRATARAAMQVIERTSSPPTPAGSVESGREHSLDDLAFLRYLLDLALQPIEQWNGFEWVEFQFREGAVRYQLNYAQWAIALAQFTRTPAFTGYLTEAQQNLIEKMLQ